jgi:hypothetical protein
MLAPSLRTADAGVIENTCHTVTNENTNANTNENTNENTCQTVTADAGVIENTCQTVTNETPIKTDTVSVSQRCVHTCR